MFENSKSINDVSKVIWDTSVDIQRVHDLQIIGIYGVVSRDVQELSLGCWRVKNRSVHFPDDLISYVWDFDGLKVIKNYDVCVRDVGDFKVIGTFYGWLSDNDRTRSPLTVRRSGADVWLFQYRSGTHWGSIGFRSIAHCGYIRGLLFGSSKVGRIFV